MSEAVELEPCPFCGSDGVASVHPEIDTMHIAGCSDADCIAAYVAYDFTSRDTAIAAWNRRALTGEAEPVGGRSVQVGPDAANTNNRRLFVDGSQWAKVYGWDKASVEERCAQLVAALTRPPIAWPDREAVARALHARYEERARQRGTFNAESDHTILGGRTLTDCSPSLRRSFLEDAEAVLALFPQGEAE